MGPQSRKTHNGEMMEQFQDVMLREQIHSLEEVQAVERERALAEIYRLMELHEISIQQIQVGVGL